MGFGPVDAGHPLQLVKDKGIERSTLFKFHYSADVSHPQARWAILTPGNEPVALALSWAALLLAVMTTYAFIPALEKVSI